MRSSHDEAVSTSMLQHLWRIELLGGLRVDGSDQSIVRFRTRKTAQLLAYLAYHSSRSHPREELMDLLWPESDTEAAHTNLRVALNSLRRQLEPPGIPAGSALIADHASIRIHPSTICTDVDDFETALGSAARTHDPAKRLHSLSYAVELYQGDLLPGFYEDWVLRERQRLADAYLAAVQDLIHLLEQSQDLNTAIEYAHLAVRADPLREEAHCDLMRLYAKVGRHAEARRHYRELERLLQEELDATPAPATRQLLASMAVRQTSTPSSSRTKRISIADNPTVERSP